NRLKRDKVCDPSPVWAAEFLQRIGDYSAQTRPFHLDLHGTHGNAVDAWIGARRWAMKLKLNFRFFPPRRSKSAGFFVL
ncbi:MAG TPA: hypothetical protein VG963_32255, partial [Polyangiaceae bacterium]|nr:hypothetical protein [Polyangiaceae bacterium]